MLSLYLQDVGVLLGNGDGTFQERQVFGQDDFTSNLALGDFNHDGNLDAVTFATYGSSGPFTILEGDGMGGFLGTFSVDICCGQPLNPLIVGDFNRDGNSDLAMFTFAGLVVLQGAP